MCNNRSFLSASTVILCMLVLVVWLIGCSGNAPIPPTPVPSAAIATTTVSATSTKIPATAINTPAPIPSPTSSPLPSPKPSATPSPTQIPIVFQKGIALPSWYYSDYCEPAYGLQAIEDIAHTGAEWVQLVPTWYQAAPDSSNIKPDSVKTAHDECLVSTIKVAHSYNLKVMLKPHFDPLQGYRSDFSPTNPTIWFQDYDGMIQHYADIADKNQVDSFVVGTELAKLSGSPYTDRWKALISQVKQMYSGPITYAANWDEYWKVKFWAELDYIGIDAYFPLSQSDNPSTQEILGGWNSFTDNSATNRWLDQLHNFVRSTDKKVVFTEIGYASQNGAARQPWSQDILPTPIPNANLQMRLYDAAFRTFWADENFEGMYWWFWDMKPDPRYKDTGYMPKQQAMQDLQNWYKLKPREMLPTPIITQTATPTSTSVPAANTNPPPTQPPDLHGFDWEDCKTDGWQPQMASENRSIVSVVGSRDFAKTGNCSLLLDTHLRGQDPQISKGEAYFELNKPLSFEGKTITCWAYVPRAEAFGPTNRFNGAQVFVKDDANPTKSNYGIWQNLNKISWIQVTLDVGRVGDGIYIEPGFNPSAISTIGVKIGTGSGANSNYYYDGFFYVDSCTW